MRAPSQLVEIDADSSDNLLELAAGAVICDLGTDNEIEGEELAAAEGCPAL